MKMSPQELRCMFDYYSGTELINRPWKNEGKVLVFENFKFEKHWYVSIFKNCDKFGLSNLGGIAVWFARSPTVKSCWWRSLWEDWISFPKLYAGNQVGVFGWLWVLKPQLPIFNKILDFSGLPRNSDAKTMMLLWRRFLEQKAVHWARDQKCEPYSFRDKTVSMSIKIG